jgi:hypothetical protein
MNLSELKKRYRYEYKAETVDVKAYTKAAIEGLLRERGVDCCVEVDPDCVDWTGCMAMSVNGVPFMDSKTGGLGGPDRLWFLRDSIPELEIVCERIAASLGRGEEQ